MSSLTTIGMLDLQVVSPAPSNSSAGGLALNNNFTAIANASPLSGSAPVVYLAADGSGNVATDASKSNLFSLLLTSSSTWKMLAPTNPTDGQKVTWRLCQDASGSRLLTWDAEFSWGVGSAPTLSTTPLTADYVVGIYNVLHERWDMVETNLGFKGLTTVTFSTVGTTSWTPPTGISSVKVLVVAGGGGGGWCTGGAGGAGGLIFQSSYTVTPGTAVSISVGAGGVGGTNATGAGSNGGNSSFGTLTAIGGGGGGCNGPTSNGFSGGSGGGGSGYLGSYPLSGGAGTAGQGNAGATSSAAGPGGGGGAGAAGTVPTGGAGVEYLISGVPVTYAAGGTGNTNANGAANTGNGGGGATYGGPPGGAGGSGIVIIAY